MTAPRLTCLVPFCRCTRGDRKNDPLPADVSGWEWVCPKHWRAIPAARRRAYGRVHRIWWGGPDRRGITPGAIGTHPKWGKRAVHLSAAERLWARLKRQAIEAAAGLA